MPFIMNSMQIAPLAQALGPGNSCAPAQHNRQRVAPLSETQQCTHAASAKGLHHHRTGLPQTLPSGCQAATMLFACPRVLSSTPEKTYCWVFSESAHS